MTIVFQNKIIYIPYMPPLTRSEKAEDYARVCKPVEWKVEYVRSLDRTKLAVCIGNIPKTAAQNVTRRRSKEVIVCYFQGNGGSTPPRLPLLSSTLKCIDSQLASRNAGARVTLMALSYRGFWKSSGRASQKGIERDAQALLQYIASKHSADRDVEIVLWGQSIGAGVAADAAARYLASAENSIPIVGVVLETPFTSIKTMLLALYPQKWLPYRYLSPFLRNHWDSEAALRRIGSLPPERRPAMLVVAATRDEVVPEGEADKLEQLCRDVGLQTTRQDVVGALHTDATMRGEGQEIVSSFVADVIGASDQDRSGDQPVSSSGG